MQEQEIIYTLFAFSCCLLAQKLFPSSYNQKTWRKESLLDLQYWFISSVIVTYLATFLLSVFSILAELDYKLKPSDISYIDCAACLLLIDFVGYWIHRLYHTNKLWYFHEIHHSPKEIDFLSATRFHPIENLNIIIVQFIIAIYIAGFGIEEYAIAVSIRGVYGYFVHSNLRWSLGKAGYIFSNPYFHRWHHTMEEEGLDKNFGGFFSLWDFIFGTAYLPKNNQPHNFGVGSDIGKNIWQQFVYPFEKIWGKKI